MNGGWVHTLLCASAILWSASAAGLDWDFYFGLSSGWAGHHRFEASNSESTETITGLGFTTDNMTSIRAEMDGDDAAWRVNGGAWFHEFFGVDFGYIDLGQTARKRSIVTTSTTTIQAITPESLFVTPGIFTSTSNNNSKVDLTGVSMMAKARYPLFESVDIELGLGAVHWEMDAIGHFSSSSSHSLFGVLDSSRTMDIGDTSDFDMAFGAALKARLTDSINVGIEWTRYEVSAFDDHVDFAGVSAEYHFGFTEGARISKRQFDSTPTLAREIASLWPFDRSGASVFGHWEYFVNIAGGWAEHNSVGDSDDEGVNVTVDGLTTRSTSLSVDEDAASWRITAGAYFNRHFGIEAGYIDFGTTSARSQFISVTQIPAVTFGGVTLIPERTFTSVASSFSKANINGFVLNGKFRYPICERIELAVSLGPVIWDSNGHTVIGANSFGPSGVITPPATSLFFDEDNSGIDVTYGVSLKGDLGKNFWMGFEWTKYEVGRDDRDVEFVGASLEYRFGGSKKIDSGTGSGGITF